MRTPFLFLILCAALHTAAAPRVIYSIPTGSTASASLGAHIDGRQLIITEEGREDATYELKKDRQMVAGRLDSILKLANDAQAAEVLNRLAPVQPAIEEEAARLPAEIGSSLQRFINIIALDGREGVELRAMSTQAADAIGGSSNSKWLWTIAALVAGLAIGIFGAPLLYKRMKSGDTKGGRSRTELENEIEKLEQRADERDRLIADLRTNSDAGNNATSPTKTTRIRDTKELDQLRKELDTLQKEKTRTENERNQAIARAQSAETSLQQTGQNLRTAQRESAAFEERADRYDAFFSALLTRRVAPLYDRLTASTPAAASAITAELLALGWTTISAARYFSPTVAATAVDRYNVSRLIPVEGELRTPAPISPDIRSGESAVLLTTAEILRTNGLQTLGDLSIENRRFEAGA